MWNIVLTALLSFCTAFLAVYSAESIIWRNRYGRPDNTPIVIQARKKEKMGTMDKILIIECVAIVIYIVVDFYMFWHIGSEPTTLTISFLAVCGGENGMMAWIKTRKEQERMRQWQLEDMGKAEGHQEDTSL